MGKLPHHIRSPKAAELERNDEAEPEHPPPEEEFGGGDIASPEICPPTEDDRPLD
jgi:hypothetical protein